MVCLLNPTVWIGLLTLILLEIVLNIDNLIFVAMLSGKLPPTQRDKARFIGLSFSLTIRLILLTTISWMITLTNPIFSNKYFNFSGRDFILLSGGLFLLFKATIELHEKLEGYINHHKYNKNYSGFWIIVIQIIFIDIIFSLDSIITAVGMINQLFIMIFAVIIATIIMLIASKTLTKFINTHKTIVVLCLTLLLIVGSSLILESFGIYIPKIYIYISIGFALLIEIFNQITFYNLLRYQSLQPIRKYIVEFIFNLIKKNNKTKKTKKYKFYYNRYNILTSYVNEFEYNEKYIITNILTLGYKSIRSIMTLRQEIIWINTNHDLNQIKMTLLKTPHNLIPVCKGVLDNIIGIVTARELLMYLNYKKMNIEKIYSGMFPIIIPDTLHLIHVITVLKKNKKNIIIVVNKFGIVQGLITPLDILKMISLKH